LSDQLLSEIRRWQPASVTQQDDITLVIIDVPSPRWDSEAIADRT